MKQSTSSLLTNQHRSCKHSVVSTAVTVKLANISLSHVLVEALKQ